MRLRWLLLGALGVAVVLPVAAQREAYVKRGVLQRQAKAWVEEASCGVPVQEGARLVVRADLGTVRVRPGAADRVECRVQLNVFTSSEEDARRLLSRYELTARRVTGGGAYVAGRFVSDRGHSGRVSVAYNIEVPLRFNLDLETQGGNMAVEQLEGELRVATAGGDITTGDVNGPVRAETAGGNIKMGQIGQRLEARTAGGCVEVGDVKGDAILETSGGQILAGRIDGRVRAETAGGDIVLRSAGADVIAQTAGGQIRIGESGGSVRAETAGGSIHLDAARGPIRAETAGGSIDLYGIQSAVRAATAGGKILAQIAATSANFAASELETAFGDVEVYLPADLPLTIEATIEMSAGHRVQTDFPLQVEGDETGYRSGALRAFGALNGGGATLRIRTVDGDIEIRKIDTATLERLQQRQQMHWKRWQQQQQRREEREKEHEKERKKRKEPD
ncbi:MAG: hypothetical protein HY656_01905 [Acidobacteria bacterium]|nr:hypothetical protein [Acidobacteriota bacterium]